MQNINIFIRDNVCKISNNPDKNLHVAPDIPDKKLNNIAKSMNLQDDYNYIIALLDSSLLGNGKEGVAFTGERMVYKTGPFTSPNTIYFGEIETVEYVQNRIINNKGKEKIEKHVSLILKDGCSYKIESIGECNLEKLADFLKAIIEQFDSFGKDNQLISLSEMSEELKVAYIKVVINMVYFNNSKPGEKSLSEIQLLMTRLELNSESRFVIREYLFSENERDNLESLIQTIDKECIPSHNESVIFSLVKDLYSVFMSMNNGDHDGFVFFEDNRLLFKISDEKVRVILEALEIDFKMLKGDVNDDTLTRYIKELSAKAGAVGVPLAAVYLSGSVVGMSAAGLTSGLATLGLGGLLGFSSMATGIGVAVLIGVGTYKGIRQLTGANGLDKIKRREMMLNEVIKLTQLTISYLIEDINFIVIKLNECINNIEQQEEKFKKLMEKQRKTILVMRELRKKGDELQGEKFKLKCPLEPDNDRLKFLTRDVTKKQIYTFILSFYEEKDIEVKNDEKTVIRKRLVRKPGISTLELEKLSDAFEAIGYFNAIDVAKSKLHGVFS
ncbi:hypothetical protein EYX55_26765 [Escherichia coli]|nr:hypothetical protein [Escherichia coli]EFA5327410.1 hypothetical protein [Escherichia coli]EFE5989016.1 hypothetical protein [Escherichia coli]EJN3747050.1 hypothetical protein [Escherichia coli]EJN3790118.1 hypothetical protein [Escherichia coli]ELO3196336.1 hypothetical protein [Escherichia coli]